MEAGFIALIALPLYAQLLAWYGEAPREARMIADGEEIDHAELMVRRLLFTAPVVVWTWWMVTTSLLALAAYSAMVWACFTIFHRYRLNELRRLPWDYISLSNIYDSIWVWMAGHWGGYAAYLFEYLVNAAAVIYLIAST